MKSMMRNLIAAALIAMPLAATAAEPGQPSFISDADWSHIKNLIDPSVVKWAPYKGLGVKKDGSPYRVLDLRLWMGDDYNVVAHFLAQTELEQGGVKYTLLSADFDAAAQARMLEDAIATKAYDAVFLHPLDPGGIAATVAKATAAGIDVYNWVTPVTTDKVTAFAGYKADTMEANGQIGAKFLEQAKAAGATKDKPYRVLEIWGFRSAPLCVERHKGLMMGIGDSGIVQVVESVDTAGAPEAETKAIEDAFARYPDIKGIYPQFGDAGATIEALRAVGKLAPIGDPNHVTVILQDIDKAMLTPLRDGTFDATVSNNPWHQMDVLVKQFYWHTVLKQPLVTSGSGLPKTVFLPMPFLTKDTIDMQKAHMWGGTVAFTDMPLGKWNEWPVLDTTSIGLPVPTLDDRKRLLGY
jgi:ABC-type sugar transport system substrate-binding protein